MLDIWRIRKEPDQVQENFRRRGLDISVGDILVLDRKKLRLQTELQELRHEKKRLSMQMSERKKVGIETDELLKTIRDVSQRLDGLSQSLRQTDRELQDILVRLPNLTDEDVGTVSKVVGQFGEKPVFDFPVLSHLELCRRHGLVDYERAGRLMGGGYWIYRGLGARLEWALLNFCLLENQKAGYEMVMPPPVAREACGFGAGQFPKFAGEVYRLRESELFLIPTAETVLVNMHREEILEAEKLPLRYTACTPCFRRENSKKPDERGMLRGHQFNKVELVQFTAESRAEKAFADVLAQAESLMRQLGLHYRVVKLAAGECGYSMRRTCDIEVWLPAEQVYKEVSSVSCAGDYQARRTNTRYRDENGKLRYVYTLNGSGLATSRLFAAVLEQNQREDGSIRIPEALVSWVGADRIS